MSQYSITTGSGVSAARLICLLEAKEGNADLTDDYLDANPLVTFLKR